MSGDSARVEGVPPADAPVPRVPADEDRSGNGWSRPPTGTDNERYAPGLPTNSAGD